MNALEIATLNDLIGVLKYAKKRDKEWLYRTLLAELDLGLRRSDNITDVLDYAAAKLIAALALWKGFQSEGSEKKTKTAGSSYLATGYANNARGKSLTIGVVIPTAGSRASSLVHTLATLHKLHETRNTIVAVVGEIREAPSWVELVRDNRCSPCPPSQKRNLGAEHVLRKGADVVIFIDDNVIVTDVLAITKLAYASLNGAIVSPLAVSANNVWLGLYHDYEGTLNGAYYGAAGLLYATTFCLAVPGAVFHDNIWFNESIRHAAGEDIDFSLRARNAGYPIKPQDDIKIRHAYGYSPSREMESLTKFILRYERYGRGNRQILSLHPQYYELLAATRPRRTRRRPPSRSKEKPPREVGEIANILHRLLARRQK